MLTDNNSIIVVDNNPDDLDRIAKVFNKHGIGCKLIETDGFDLPERPLEGVKIAFMDINFNNPGDDIALFSTLLSVIKGVISKSNGPFVIVFWTTNSDKIESFKEFVNRDDNTIDLPYPLDMIPLDKASFVDNDDGLKNALNGICSKPLIKCLFSFGEELLHASDICLSEITKHIVSSDNWGDCSNYENKIKNLFSKLSYLSAGFENGHKYPDKAIKEALAPVFLHLLSNNGISVWADYLQIQDKDETYFKGINIEDVAPHLNTFLHIDTNVQDREARGIVRTIDVDDDYFKNKIGSTKQDWVIKQILNSKYTMTQSYTIIAVEFSAACDYAQSKQRLHKYIMGLLCNKDDYINIDKKKKSIGENIFSAGFIFSLNNKELGIVLDFNSIISEEQTDEFKILGEPLIQLKNDLMNVIGSKYSDHISRIGFNVVK